MTAVALTIAGSDPSGGAGIQADLKTFARFGVYGTAAITLLSVQNTRQVTRVEVMPPDLVREQIESVLADVPPGAAKTGALGNSSVVQAIADLARDFRFPLIVDPVMISKHGHPLLDADAVRILRNELLRNAALVTPNLPEAEALTGMRIRTEQDMLPAAAQILALGCEAVLIKGGHLQGEPVDVLQTREQSFTLRYPRLTTPHTHGTGCTYSAAITALLAQGVPLAEAVRRAREFLQRAIATAPGLGAGHGPLNHFA
jgi:hydroxymethylpyrimidine/phosphomethylpyrimidine kinase